LVNKHLLYFPSLPVNVAASFVWAFCKPATAESTSLIADKTLYLSTHKCHITTPLIRQSITY
jgi:hypothetical protein